LWKSQSRSTIIVEQHDESGKIMESLQKIDHTALKINQVVIVLLNVLAFVLNLPWLALVVGLVMQIGTLLGIPGFGFVYRYAVKPLGWAKPYVVLDHPEPHRFSQGFGSVVMLAGSLALFIEATVLGWSLVWLVAALAALNAFGGFCAGCFLYYWLNRLKVPGFSQSPPPDTFPGMRPKGELSQGEAYES
jgi:Domain of unknown function (DUF4395)